MSVQGSDILVIDNEDLVLVDDILQYTSNFIVKGVKISDYCTGSSK